MGFREVNHLRIFCKIMFTFEFWVTLAVTAGGAAVVGLMAWLEKRPKTELQPRLFPTTLVMVIAALVVLMAGFHMLDLVKPVAGH
jgi:hypothetical protein